MKCPGHLYMQPYTDDTGADCAQPTLCTHVACTSIEEGCVQLGFNSLQTDLYKVVRVFMLSTICAACESHHGSYKQHHNGRLKEIWQLSAQIGEQAQGD